MSKIKFEKAMLLIAGEFINELSWWPEWFPPVNLAVLQSPHKDHDTRAWQAAIELAVKTGELASTLKPYLLRLPFSDLSKEFTERGIPCDQDTITAPDFAAWLTAQGEKPSEHIDAWLAAAGVQAGTVDRMTTAPPKPVLTAGASGDLGWRLIQPKRYQGYGKPLYDLLKAAASIAGQPCPKARDVIDAWKADRPHDVFEVESNQIGYYDTKGKEKFANLDAIRKAINRMIRPTTGRLSR